MKKNILIYPSSFLIALYFLFGCHSAASTNSLPSDPATIAKGENLFNEKCNGCHNIYFEGIGPELAGVTSSNSVSWIKNFIRDPQNAIASGDTTAQKLYKRYKSTMPSFGYLPDGEVDAILAFLNTKKKKERVLVKEDNNDIKNPIPDSIRTSDVVVGVEPLTQIPASSDQMPKTRVIKLDYRPDTKELYVLDLRGKLYKLDNGQPKLYMDMARLRPKFITQPGLATGFGSFAFHPDFAKNGLLYTTHAEMAHAGKADFSYPDSIPVLLQWVVTEWKTDPNHFPFTGTGREIFRIDMPTSIHGIQEIAFNPHAHPGDGDYGLLYMGIGDGGSREIGSPLVSPNPTRVWGSILRIDPAGHNSKNGQYGIPSTNPFAKNNPSQYAQEVYAYGFRNPHRISWTKSGQLMSINIGEHNIEALNMILPGHFYGWPIREGTFREQFFNDMGKIYPLPADDSIYHVTYPVAMFDHDEGSAICGGFEYSGNRIPQLKGKFVFGDIGSGKLFFVNMKDLKLGRQAMIKKWNISINGVPTTLAELCKSKRVEMRYGMDSKGDLYVLTKADGKVYKLVNPGKKSS
jgi:glucose/arabinose dehydrogenase/mono/diheme cytochrome c family protein